MTATIAPSRTVRPPESSDRPRWVRPALWAVLAAALVLYAWGLSANGYANTYYAAAVKSGTESWKAFFFGALDSGSFITVDKPPMALWLMGLSARIFGFGTWSLLLPQALAGVAAVRVLYATVRRAFGYRAGLVAALVLTLTPMTVAINRDNNPDTLLVLFMVLAAWAGQRAIEAGRRGWLLASAFFVGCAFNTKMLQAYLVVPALALAYLIAARPGWLRRVGHLLAAGAVLAVSSFWWMAFVDLMPTGSRPYIGGSTDNTVWDLVVGYNGLGRISGSGGGGGPGGANFGGDSGAGRLFNEVMGGQISWLLPFAALALVAGLVLLRRRPRTDLARAALVLWGVWLVVHFVVFSLSSGGFHPYYVTAMAPAIAALTGAGAVLLYDSYRPLLVAGIAVTGLWSYVLLSRTPDWNPWLRWLVVVATVAAVVALLGRRLVVPAVILALVAGLAGPAAYAVSAASSRVNGTDPLAGPVSRGGPGGMPGRPPTGMRGPEGSRPPMGGGGGRPGGQLGGQVVSYLQQNKGTATWLVAVDSAQPATSLILQTGEPVIAMGGFTGSDPAMTVAKLQEYVRDGKLRFILLGGDGRGNRNFAVTQWVQQNGTRVESLGDVQLYDLSGRNR